MHGRFLRLCDFVDRVNLTCPTVKESAGIAGGDGDRKYCFTAKDAVVLCEEFDLAWYDRVDYEKYLRRCF